MKCFKIKEIGDKFEEKKERKKELREAFTKFKDKTENGKNLPIANTWKFPVHCMRGYTSSESVYTWLSMPDHVEKIRERLKPYLKLDIRVGIFAKALYNSLKEYNNEDYIDSIKYITYKAKNKKDSNEIDLVKIDAQIGKKGKMLVISYNQNSDKDAYSLGNFYECISEGKYKVEVYLKGEKLKRGQSKKYEKMINEIEKVKRENEKLKRENKELQKTIEKLEKENKRRKNDYDQIVSYNRHLISENKKMEEKMKNMLVRDGKKGEEIYYLKEKLKRLGEEIKKVSENANIFNAMSVIKEIREIVEKTLKDVDSNN